MALDDKKRKEIVRDYIRLGNCNAVAKLHGVSHNTVKNTVEREDMQDVMKKMQQKKEENSKVVLEYMDAQTPVVCEIIGKGLEALNDPEKLANAPPTQITTAIGTLIDKWVLIKAANGSVAQDKVRVVIDV